MESENAFYETGLVKCSEVLSIKTLEQEDGFGEAHCVPQTQEIKAPAPDSVINLRLLRELQSLVTVSRFETIYNSLDGGKGANKLLAFSYSSLIVMI